MVALLAHRLFYLLLHYVLLFIIPIQVFKITQEAFYLGVVFALEWGIRLLSLVVIPAVFKFHHIGTTLRKINFSQGGFILLLFIAFMLTNHLVFLVLIAMMSSIFFDMNFLCVENFVQNHFKNTHLLKCQSYLQAIEQGSFLFAPILAGILTETINFNFILVGIAIAFLLLALLKLEENLAHSTNTKEYFSFFGILHKIKEQLMLGLSLIFNSNEATKLVILTNIINLIYGASIALLPAIVLGVYAKSAIFLGNFNFFIAALGILGVIVFNKIISHKLYQSSLIIVILSLIVALGIFCGILQYFFNEMFLVLTCIALIILMDNLFSIGLRTKRQLLFQKENFKIVLPCMMLCNAIAFPLGGILVSLFTHSYSESLTLLLISCFAVFIGGSLFYLLRRKE